VSGWLPAWFGSAGDAKASSKRCMDRGAAAGLIAPRFAIFTSRARDSAGLIERASFVFGFETQKIRKAVAGKNADGFLLTERAHLCAARSRRLGLRSLVDQAPVTGGYIEGDRVAVLQT